MRLAKFRHESLHLFRRLRLLTHATSLAFDGEYNPRTAAWWIAGSSFALAAIKFCDVESPGLSVREVDTAVELESEILEVCPD